MIYITFNLNPRPCMSVKLNIFPPDIDFKILVVAAPTLLFLVLALTAIPIKGAATLTAGFKNFENLSQAVFVPQKIDFSLLLIEPPSS